MRRAPVALAVVAWCGGAACTGVELPDHLLRSPHVRYFSRGNDRGVCPALLDELEEHGRVIADAMGIARPLVTYYKFRDWTDFEANAGCPDHSGACALNATTRTPEAFDHHELIHAYLAPYGLPPPLFTEGAAVALSCEHYPRPTGTWQDALAAAMLSRSRYSGGGWLVGYLLKNFPKSRFLTLYGSLPVNAPADEVARVFDDIYEMPLDDVWAAAIGGPQEPRFCPWECTRPAFPADGTTQRLTTVCEAGTTEMTVDVVDDGISRWLLDGDAYLSVRSCDGNDAPLGQISGGGGSGTGGLLAPLVPGKYVFNAGLPGGSAAIAPLLSINPHALAGPWAFNCALGQPVMDDLSHYGNLTLFFPSSTAPQFTKFAVGRNDDAVLRWSSDDPSARGDDCTTCDEATCTPFGVGGGLGTSTPTGAALSVLQGRAAMTANIMWFPVSSPDGGV